LGLRSKVQSERWPLEPFVADYASSPGRARQNPKSSTCKQAIEAVAALADGDWRYESGDMITATIVDKRPEGDRPACLRFFRLREGDDVPHKMDIERATTPVEIAAGEAITDWTHVVIWSDGYAAHDPHRDAPTLARLAAYFRTRDDDLGALRNPRGCLSTIRRVALRIALL